MRVRAVPAAATAAVSAFEVVPSAHDEQAVFHVVVQVFHRRPGPLVLWGGIGLFACFVGPYKAGDGLLCGFLKAVWAKAALLGGWQRHGRQSVAPALFH